VETERREKKSVIPDALPISSFTPLPDQPVDLMLMRVEERIQKREKKAEKRSGGFANGPH
jgi:hypothetical protein